MTLPSDRKQERAPAPDIPEITSGEGVPFERDDAENIKTPESNSADNKLSKGKSTKGLDLEKFSLGSSMLGWCLFLMLLCIFLSIWKPDNELIKNGFEAFKLIVMTILGYIFGSNNSKND